MTTTVAFGAYGQSRQRAANLLHVARSLEALGPVMTTGHSTLVSDVLRSALVLGVSANDAYIHHLFLERLSPYIRKNPTALAAAASPADLRTYLHSIGVGNADMAALHAATGTPRTRPLSTFRAKVQPKLHKRSLQHPTAISSALQAVGLPGVMNAVAAIRGVKPTTMISRLTLITNRRNDIAHESDLFQGTRRKFDEKPLTMDEVERMLSRLVDFVNALEQHVAANPI